MKEGTNKMPNMLLFGDQKGFFSHVSLCLEEIMVSDLIEILLILFVVLLFATQTTSHITTPSFVIYNHYHYNIIISSLHGRTPRQRRSMSSSTNNNDAMDDTAPSSSSVWRPYPHATSADIALAKSLNLWPFDAANVNLLNEVRHRHYTNPTPKTSLNNNNSNDDNVYDLVVIGAGAGGLVSSRQSARRGARSCMISSELAGGDCLNAGCVPSKALLRCAKLIRETSKAITVNSDDNTNEYGVYFHARDDDDTPNDTPSSRVQVDIEIDFGQIMNRMRKLRSQIAPIDGHDRGITIGTQVYQGYGVFTSPTTVEVVEHDKLLGDPTNPILRFNKAVIATGGRPRIPTEAEIPGLFDAPYTTNVNLFNLETLPPRLVILGAGVVAMEMAQAFATFGSKVTVVASGSSGRLLSSSSSSNDDDVISALRTALENDGVNFLTNVKVNEVTTLRQCDDDDATTLPLMKVALTDNNNGQQLDLECECLLLAMGRVANVNSIGLEAANIKYDPTHGILVNENSQSISNNDIYAVGDCVAHVPRLTHVSGEMAKVVVQNSLFDGSWKLSSLVIPSVMYTDPEVAIVKSTTIYVNENGHVVQRPHTTMPDDLVVYKTELQHNDRAILDGSDTNGFVKIRCLRGTGTIVDCTIVSTRAGEMINEVSMAIKYGLTLEDIGRNIHSYPTLGEAVMACGIQYINANWSTLND